MDNISYTFHPKRQNRFFYPTEYCKVDYVRPKTMYKSEMAELYGLSWRIILRDIQESTQLQELLASVGYIKHAKILRPIWVMVFFFHYTPPLKE